MAGFENLGDLYDRLAAMATEFVRRPVTVHPAAQPVTRPDAIRIRG
jgi:hypothetical protein